MGSMPKKRILFHGLKTRRYYSTKTTTIAMKLKEIAMKEHAAL